MRISVLVIVALTLLPLSATAGVTFVSSDAELATAQVDFDREAITGLAVSSKYVGAVSPEIKAQMQKLILSVKQKERGGVYVYGDAVDPIFAKQVLETKRAPECAPMIFAGTFNSPMGIVLFCRKPLSAMTVDDV